MSLLILGFILWIFSKGPQPSPAATSTVGGPDATMLAASAQDTAPSKRVPSFCGVPLGERVIVYVIDRGSATAEVFGNLTECVYKSIESLGPERKFQIIFWNNGSSGEAAFPQAGPTFASSANIEQARRRFEDLNAHGQSDIASALTKAVSSRPDAIVLATGKAYELNDAFVSTVERICGPAQGIKIYTFALGGASQEPGSALKSIANRSGGQYAGVSAADLRQAAGTRKSGGT